MKYSKAIIDFETGSLCSPEVLQCSIIVTTEDNLPIGFYNNYFLHTKAVDPKAIEVNKLTDDILAERAKGTFRDEINRVIEILEGADEVWAFNADFDIERVLNYNAQEFGLPQPNLKKILCAMKAYTNICKIPSKLPTVKYKYPKLSAAVDYLVSCGKLDMVEEKKKYEEMFESEAVLHDSLYDTYCTYLLIKNL